MEVRPADDVLTAQPLLVVVLAALSVLPLARSTCRPSEKVDLDAVYRIKDEGLQRSKVMEITSYLTDVYGPRLTGSPNFKEAADWTQKTMKEWGLANIHLESFPFGRGWQNQRFVALAMTPRAYPLVGFPKAWTPGTNGPLDRRRGAGDHSVGSRFRHLARQAAR